MITLIHKYPLHRFSAPTPLCKPCRRTTSPVQLIVNLAYQCPAVRRKAVHMAAKPGSDIQDIPKESAGTKLPLPGSPLSRSTPPLPRQPLPAPALRPPPAARRCSEPASATSLRAHSPGGSQTLSRPGGSARTGPGSWSPGQAAWQGGGQQVW